jgi:predicted  nucleic acid-binding Zn-ribbon protein
MEGAMTTDDTVEALLFLQEIDREIGRNTVELEALIGEQTSLEESLAELESKVAQREAAVEAAHAKLTRAERTVQAGRETLKRLQTRAQEVHNMREHLAARAEVDAARRNLDAAEDEVLECMQALEMANQAVEELETEIEQARAGYEERRSVIDVRRAELEDAIAVQNGKRENRTLRMDSGVKRLYDKVRGGRTSVAVAPVMDDVCGNCFTAIPKQRQAEIRAGRDLVVCEACGVILHANN